MSSRRRSTCDRKHKECHHRDKKCEECHHSRNHRDKKCERNTSGIIEPVYVTDPMPSHNNNVPVFFHAPFYGPSNSTWNPTSVGYMNPPTLPVFPNVNHPTQLSIGPLYLLAENIKENSVIRESMVSVSVDKKKSTLESNEQVTNVIKNDKPDFVNVIAESYHLPQGNEAFNVVNTWNSHNRTKRNILIDTPTQYEYMIPTSNKILSSLSNKFLFEESEGISETSHLTSIHSSESRSQVSEKESSDLTFPDRPQGDLTVLRVVDMKKINQGEESHDLNSPHTSRASKLQTTKLNRKTLGKNRENPRIFCIQVPIGMNGFERERSLYCSVKNGFKYDRSRINTKSETNKRMNGTTCRSSKRSNAKSRNFRGMTTEDSINDLYEKIKEIQSSIGASSVNGLLTRQSEQEARPTVYPVPFESGLNSRQLRFYDSDIPVAGTNTISRGINPINFRSIENSGSFCTCCHQCACGRNSIDTGQRYTNSTRDIDTLTEFPNNLNQSSSSYYPETGYPNDGFSFAKMQYSQPNTSFNPDNDLYRESVDPVNDNTRIIIDQEAESQYPSIPRIRHETYNLPRQDICHRPCYCPENSVQPTKTSIACDSNESIRNGPSVRLMPSISPEKCDSIAPNTVRCPSTNDNSTFISSIEMPLSRGNQFHCNPNEEPDESRPSSVQRSTMPSTTSLEDTQFCICPTNPPNPCHCDLNKELCDIMDKIEDNIILKLEKKRMVLSERSLQPSPPGIQECRATRSTTVRCRQSEFGNSGMLPTRIEGPDDIVTSAPILDKKDCVTENNFVNPTRESSDFSRCSIIREPGSTLRSQTIIDSGLRGSGLRDSGIRNSGLRDSGLRDSGLRDSGLRDSILRDSGSRDSGSSDSRLRDSGLRYSRSSDSRLRDSGLRHSRLRHSRLRDSTLRDSGLRHSRLRDSTLRDSGLRNSRLRDSGLRNSKSGYIEEDSYRETPHISHTSLSSQNMRGSSLYKRRNARLSSFLRRRSLRRREPPSLFPSFGPGRRYASSVNYPYINRGPIRSYRGRPATIDGFYSGRPNYGPSTAITDVLTAIPHVESDKEATKDNYTASKDTLKSETISSSNTTIEKNEKDGKSSNSCKIRRIKLSRKNKHIYILVKKRNKAGKNPSQETLSISSVRTKSPKVLGEKIPVSKRVKSKKIHKIYLKSKNEK